MTDCRRLIDPERALAHGRFGKTYTYFLHDIEAGMHTKQLEHAHQLFCNRTLCARRSHSAAGPSSFEIVEADTETMVHSNDENRR